MVVLVGEGTRGKARPVPDSLATVRDTLSSDSAPKLWEDVTAESCGSGATAALRLPAPRAGPIARLARSRSPGAEAPGSAAPAGFTRAGGAERDARGAGTEAGAPIGLSAASTSSLAKAADASCGWSSRTVTEAEREDDAWSTIRLPTADTAAALREASSSDSRRRKAEEAVLEPEPSRNCPSEPEARSRSALSPPCAAAPWNLQRTA